MTPDSLRAALGERTLALVDVPSPSRDEAAVYRYLKQAVPLEPLYDDGETLLYAQNSGRPLVLLAGHTDTVPAQGNLPGRLEDGWVLGLGASDMKGGLAVMVELARRLGRAELAYDLGLLFFPREELGPADNPLPALFAAVPRIEQAALVICLEPTDNTLQLGCLGNINARVVFQGRPAHSARPWLGVNAIRLACEGLQEVLGLELDRRHGRRARLSRGGERHADRRLRQRHERHPGPASSAHSTSVTHRAAGRAERPRRAWPS